MALTIPDQSIALQAKAPDGMQSLSSLLNIANGAQTLKRAQATYDSDVSQRASESSSAAAKATVDNANVNPKIAQQLADTSTAQTGAEAAKYKLHGDYAGTMLQTAAGALSDPRISGPDYKPEEAGKALTEAFQQAVAKGVPPDQALLAVSPFMNAIHQPGAVAQMLKNTVVGQMGASGQQSALTPSLVQNSNGQQTITTNINPLAPGGVGAQPIAPIQQQLPPTTPTMDGGVPGYLGPQGGQGQSEMGFDPSKLSQAQKAQMLKVSPDAYARGVEAFYKRGQPQQGRVASGLPIGAAEGIQGTQGVVNDDWKNSVTQANGAQRTIGILQNIKQYSAGAAGGIGADRQAFTAGLAGLLGMDAGELVKTNTDLLAKNSNMLALAGGNTDAARAMAEAANPNAHMTKEALAHAADQLIGQQQLNLARVQYLTPFKAQADAGHPEMYQAALNQFNSVADPRIVQFSSMSPEDKSAMKSSMSEKERAEFGKKLGKARTLGIAQ